MMAIEEKLDLILRNQITIIDTLYWLDRIPGCTLVHVEADLKRAKKETSEALGIPNRAAGLSPKES